MNVSNLKDMYVAELQEARSLEEQLVDALPKMADKATDPGLKEGMTEHLGETRSHLQRVEDILERHGANPREHTDQSMQRLIGESEKWAGMVDDTNLRDAGLIASAQRIEHYEIAAYGTLACWAKQLGLKDDLETLLSILEEEKAADGKLSELAKREVNPEAAH